MDTVQQKLPLQFEDRGVSFLVATDLFESFTAGELTIDQLREERLKLDKTQQELLNDMLEDYFDDREG